MRPVFQQTPREIVKMRYLWEQPLRPDNRKLVAVLGDEPSMPLTDAVRMTLRALDVR
jgi:nucleoside-diphosphate-sugar epimerase